MKSQDLVRAGNLTEARRQLNDELRASPGDLSRRTLLFQVLAFLGEWDKADRHLDVIVTQDPARETGVQVYKNLIRAERERIEVRRAGAHPSMLPEVPGYMALYLAAWGKISENDVEEAMEELEQVDARRPTVSGVVGGRSFTGFKDTDDFLSPFLELIIYDKYTWMPFEHIRELAVSPPTNLFDLLWIPGRVTTWKGFTTNCYLPVLYPESFLHEDERVKLGRTTDWKPANGPFWKGMGQHVYQLGGDEISLLELREVTFTTHGTSSNV